MNGINGNQPEVQRDFTGEYTHSYQSRLNLGISGRVYWDVPLNRLY